MGGAQTRSPTSFFVRLPAVAALPHCAQGVRCALCRAWARLCALRPAARAWGPDSLRSPFGFAVCGLGGERQKTRNLQRSFFQALRRFVWALSLPLARRRQLHRYIERETDRIEQEARRRGDRRRVKEQGMSAQSHFRLLRSPRLVRCQASSPGSQGPTINDAEPFFNTKARHVRQEWAGESTCSRRLFS